MKRGVFRWLLPAMLLASAADAQTAQPQQQVIDPRLAGPMVDAVQSMLKLREAELRMTVQDYEARLDTAMLWLKAAQDEEATKKSTAAKPVAK